MNHRKAKNSTRRQFLGKAVGAAALWGGFVLPEARGLPPSDRLAVASIGTSGRAQADWSDTSDAGAEIVALCDVDETSAVHARKRFPDAKFFIDFRDLLDQRGFDAVIVATPDHIHAVASIMALKAGFHVYCEKPLTHTVQEARVMAETAAREKRVTQMGNQIHAGGNYRRVVELVQGGAIGKVGEVHVWCGKSWGGGERPREMPPAPAGLHYDLWVGAAPYRPYHPIYLPANWRRWWDFGGGTIADMACHYMDLPFWALKLRHPVKVEAEGPPVHPETTPEWLIVRWEFPARDDLPPVKFAWYDGGKRPALFEEKKLPDWGDGVLFVGEKGMLMADYDRYKLLPEESFKDFKPPAPSIPESIGHHKEWVEACKTGGPTTCLFDYTGALTETVLLGNVAYRIGKPLAWDAKNLRATNAPEADRYIRKEYRKPWSV
jgi:predicted dehydrogenase